MSAQANAAQGFRPAQDQNPKTAEAEQTGDGEADRQRGPPAPRGKPRIVTVDVGKHRPAQCSSCWMAARQGQPSHGTRRAGLVAPSRRPATCTLPPPTMAAAAPARSLRHPDPPRHSQAAAAAPPKGRAAPPACSPRQSRGPTLWIWGRRRETLGSEKRSSVSLVEPHARGGRPPGSEVPPPPDPPGLCPAGSTGGGRGRGRRRGGSA